MAGEALIDPDDDGTYLVYADYLTSKGDPHGELIVLMQQLDAAQDDEQRAYLGNALVAYQTKHRAKLFGELGKHEGIRWDFHLGFLRSVHYLPDLRDDTAKVVTSILKLPIARYLRQLYVYNVFERHADAVRAAVEAHKPATLATFELVKQYESLEAANGEPELVKWAKIAANSTREPPAVSKLSNLVWLELRGNVQEISSDLAKLTKLHRLDLDYCFGLRTAADEVFGIETLSYVSMYSCGLPKTYHMGRLNNLLFGFSRARTPSRRRIIELNLMLGNVAKAKKLATRGDLLAALDNNVGVVREAALRLLGDSLPDPFAKSAPAAGASFALIGKTNLDKKQIAKQLGERDIALTQKIDDATTHVILGMEPGGKQAAIGARPIVLDSHLQKLFAGKSKPSKRADVDAIRAGLRSGDEKATAKAVAAITTFDETLLPELVVVLSDTELGKSREAAKKLVALHAPKVKAAFDAHLKSSVLNRAMGESKRSDRIAAFARQSNVDGLAIALLLVERAKLGLAYVREYGSSADITRALEAIAEGTTLNLSGMELSTIPAEITKLTKIEELDLSGNHFNAFPEGVLAMKSLVRLDVSRNDITKIPDSIGKTKLEKLDVSHNRWRKFPTAVLGISTLVDLEVSNSQQYVENEARIKGLPAEISKLPKLKRFSYRFNVLEAFPETLWKLPLEELDVGWCTLPDEIPPELGTLKKLRKLTVMYSGWADKKKQLKKLLPKCEIS